VYIVQEASCKRGFDPVYPLLSDLYHNSESKYFSIFTNLIELGSISAGFQWMGLMPAGFEEGFRAVCIRIDMYVHVYMHMNLYICMYIRIYVYMYMYIHGLLTCNLYVSLHMDR